MFSAKMTSAICLMTLLAHAAGQKACFQDYALASSLAGTDTRKICGAVFALNKCAQGDAAMQRTVDQIAAQNQQCDPTQNLSPPTLTTDNNHLHVSVDAGKDVNFFRYTREKTSVWSLKKDIDDVVATKVDQKGVDAEIKKLDASTTKRVSGITDTVSNTKKTLTDSLQTSSSTLDKTVKATLADIEKEVAAFEKELNAMVTKQISDAKASAQADLKAITERVSKVEATVGDCNYATHYKKGGKCVMFTDCAAAKGGSATQYVGFLNKGTRQGPGYILDPGTKDKDHVCGSASYNRWYKLGDSAYFQMVPWPAWMYPHYTESALTQVCKLAGLKPWRDQSSWGCNPEQYVCDNWGYNLGGHDFLSKIRCRLGGGTCYGHSGDWMVNSAQMGEDVQRMHPDWKKGTDDYHVVAKRYHSSFYTDSSNYMKLKIANDGKLQFHGGYYNGRPSPKEMKKGIALCAYSHN